jgi:hypothetical protein
MINQFRSVLSFPYYPNCIRDRNGNSKYSRGHTIVKFFKDSVWVAYSIPVRFLSSNYYWINKKPKFWFYKPIILLDLSGRSFIGKWTHKRPLEITKTEPTLHLRTLILSWYDVLGRQNRMSWWQMQIISEFVPHMLLKYWIWKMWQRES